MKIDPEKEKWRHITNNYYVSNYGRMGRQKTHGFYYLIPNKHFENTIFITKNNKQIAHIRKFVRMFFDTSNLEFTEEYRNYIVELNRSENSNLTKTGQKEDYKNEPMNLFKRKCTDCGKPTNNYRCHKCWELKKDNTDREYMDLCSHPDEEFNKKHETFN